MPHNCTLTRRVRGLLLLFVLIASALTGAYAQPVSISSQTNTSIDAGIVKLGYAADFDTIATLVKDRVFDPHVNHINLRALIAKYRSRLDKLNSKTEFELLVNDMLRGLGVSHASYVTDDDFEFYMFPSVTNRDMNGHVVEHIGIIGIRNSEGFVVQSVLDASPASDAGIVKGDVIQDEPGSYFCTASTFRGRSGKRVWLHIQRGSATFTLEVVPVSQNPLRAFLNAMNASARIIEYRGRRIGYVHLWTMANDSFKLALDALVLEKLHDTDGMILDLRDGFGGSPFGFADVFTRPDVDWGATYRDAKPTVEHTGYSKPVVVLINGGTRSAKEFLAYQLKVSHRATLIGTKTAGAFLGAGFFPIGNLGYLELPVVNLSVDGRRLEGIGVLPDIAVPATDKDGVLDRCLDVAMEAVLKRGGFQTGDRSGSAEHNE